MIYLDLVFLLNFIYDFFLLLTVGITLKRVFSIKRLLISSLVGAVSIFLLFLNINTILIFIFKITISILMILIAFSYKDIKYFITNIIYLYMDSIILAGFMYYLNIEFSYKNNGLIFYFDSFNINYLLIILLAPIILVLYIRHIKLLKEKKDLVREVKIVKLDNSVNIVKGFIDSGNKLKDIISNKYVIIIDKNIFDKELPIYVPYNTVNSKGLIKCYKVKYIEINNQVFKNYLIGISNTKINIDGISCILNYKLLEDLNV